MRYLILLSVFMVSACTNIQSMHLTGYDAEFPDPPIIEDLYPAPLKKEKLLADVYTLTDVQQQQFLLQYNSPDYKKLLPNKRIARYVKKNLSGFGFYPDTLTASQSISRKLGNCLSMAIVTKALADLVEVETYFELVATPPLYQKAGEIVLISQHVRTVLMDPKPGEVEGYHPLWRSLVRIDYFSSKKSYRLRKVKHLEFQTMYYTNTAAEALGRNEDALAYWKARESLQLSKAEPQTINMLAIIHDRAGYKDTAEKLYHYGLKYGGENFELLHNYHQLLLNQNRGDEAQQIAKRLQKYNDPNPYKWVELGDKEFLAKNFSNAIYYYKKANKMADYLHEPYAGIARAQYSLGNLRLAKIAIKKAIKNTDNQDIVDAYRNESILFYKTDNHPDRNIVN